VSAVTDAVLESRRLAEPRLEATYAIVFFDAIRVKIRNEGMVNNRRFTWRLGCVARATKKSRTVDRADRRREVWLRVMTELRNRGTQDILIAVVDGLKGFPER